MSAALEFSVETLPGLRPAPERWLRIAPSIEGESLTSRLGRQARLWSVPVPSLLRDLLAVDCKVLPDLDVAPPTELLAHIAARLGESPSEVEQGTLRRFLPKLMPPGHLAKVPLQRWKMSHLPWILPSGWQDQPASKLRRGAGIPYCPTCAIEKGADHSPLTHRLAFQVACERHKVWLQDRCPTCETWTSPAVRELLPHATEEGMGLRCDRCPPMLPTRAPHPERADTLAMQLQAALSTGLSSGTITLAQLGQYPTLQFLGGLRYCFFAVAWLRDQGVCLPPARPGKPLPMVVRTRGHHSGPFESLPLAERILRIKGAAWICAAPLDRWGLLHQLCAWPNNLPRSWRHPWEELSESGVPTGSARWNKKGSRQPEARDVQKVRAFFDLMDSLGLHPVRVQGLLGNISSTRYDRWRNQPTTRFPLDCYRRMEAFLRLWDRLLAFFNTPAIAQEWVIKPNRHPLFGGLAPIDALSGPGTLLKFESTVSMFGGTPLE